MRECCVFHITFSEPIYNSKLFGDPFSLRQLGWTAARIVKQFCWLRSNSVSVAVKVESPVEFLAQMLP